MGAPGARVRTRVPSPRVDALFRTYRIDCRATKENFMSIQVGDRLPEIPLQRIQNGGVETVDTNTLFSERNVVIFAVPGAFTPTCSERHLPGFVEHYEAFRAKGIDVACMSVNDPFVMQAWGESQDVPDGLMMLADGNAEFTRALGLELDAS